MKLFGKERVLVSLLDKIQIITIENLFQGKQPQLPGGADNQTFKKSQRKETKGTSYGLFD